MKRMGHYPNDMTSKRAKAYKKQKGNRLTAEQVRNLVHDALDAFGGACVGNEQWRGLIDAANAWLINDPTWITNGLYRGGKLLDDVVDTMICLSTSLGYVRQCAHAWFDPEHPDDGHIIGPGFQEGNHWVAAGPPH